MKRSFSRAAAAALSLVFLCFGNAAGSEVKLDSKAFGAIQARHIGPAVMGGRITSLDAVIEDPRIIYVGSAGGGLWKSLDGGSTFRPVFEDYTMSIGAVAIDQSEPDTVWVGTGEPWPRNSTSVGTGLYKTVDAGANWKRVGLEDSERIGRIIVAPDDSQTVYVCALGHLWNDNEQRGLYKTTDGGESWERILYVDEGVGCADLAMDPQEPEILYAAMWQFRRQPHFFNSGGPGSGLHKSVDGGKSWERLQGGLPQGELGRIAVAVAPSRASRLYAMVESEKNDVYRSDDHGATWKAMKASSNVTARPFYFGLIVADPQDHERVYKPGQVLALSSDGGESWAFISAGVHPDHHALWINPRNPEHQIAGTDGGIYVSFNRGANWRFYANLPVSQFYQVRFDMAQPYNVYGGLQDNGSWTGPSRSAGGIGGHRWKNLGGGDGFHVWPDPADPDTVYWEFQGGNVSRRSLSRGDSQSIKPYPQQGEPEYRFNWNTPIHIGASSGALYVGAQFLFRSLDQGRSWTRISPDLTSNDPDKQRQSDSGGLTIDNTTAENHCTIYTISESSLEADIIWVGTDDGNLQVTRDGGKSWTDTTPNLPGSPPGAWVSSVQASRHDPASALATLDHHRSGDMSTYVFKTSDFGATWTALATDELEGYAHVVRDDLVNPDLLFLGTEFGLYISHDGGRHWARFEGNLPKTAVRDIAIHPRDHDLILATHGRGVVIIDDLTPLRQLTPEVLASNARILDSRPVYASGRSSDQRFQAGDWLGRTIPEAAHITYYLKKRHIFGDLKIEILDPAGKPVITLPGAGKRRGINRVTWAMRGRPPRSVRSPGALTAISVGPAAAEGTYTVKLTKGKEVLTGKIELVAAPGSDYSVEERRLKQETVSRLYAMQEDLAYLATSASEVRDKARKTAESIEQDDALGQSLGELSDGLDSLVKTMVATREAQGITGEQQLRERVVQLYSRVNAFGGPPTQSQLQRSQSLEDQLSRKRQAYESLIQDRLTSLNQRLQSAGLDAIEPLSRQQFESRSSSRGSAGRQWLRRFAGILPRAF